MQTSQKQRGIGYSLPPACAESRKMKTKGLASASQSKKERYRVQAILLCSSMPWDATLVGHDVV
jgi:hypothetical protein